MKFTRGAGDSGPSSSIGIIRFFDTDSGGPKLRPEFVLGIAVALTVLIGALQFLSRKP